MQLSTGPWSYNRFNAYEQTLTEGAKPDYLDFDKDGDKKEPMKKALKEKGKKQVDEGKGEMPDFIKDKKEGKKSPCEKCKEEGKKDCNCDDDKKEDKKPAFLQKEGNCYQEGGKVKGYQKGGKVKSKEMKEALINSIMGDGLANNPVSAEIIVEHMSDEWVEAILDDLAD